MALEREVDTYQANLANMLDHEGEYVVVHGETIDGFHATYEAALEAAYRRFGLEPFLVKQVRAVEPVHYFTRGLPPCRS